MKTYWNKQKKKNRLSPAELKHYKNFLAINFPICQRCGSNPTADTHHVSFGCFGADKDDRTLLCVCNDCHLWFHKNKYEGQRLFSEIAKQNWIKYGFEKE